MSRDDAAGPLRAALVTTFYPPDNFGGDGRYVESLATALARAGVAVEVITLSDGYRALGGTARPPPADPPGVTVHRLGSRWPRASVLAMQQLGVPAGARDALAALLARPFDVIHYHNVSLMGGPGVLALGDAVKLYTAHEHWLVCPTHVLWRHGRELCDARQCIRCCLAHRRPPPAWRATGHLGRMLDHVDAFIALSRSVADNHAAFGFPRAMHPMASFLPDVAPRAVACETDPRPYALLVGRLERIKGFQEVVPLFDGSMPVDLLIAGTGDFEPELRRLAAASPQVRFLGPVAPDALPGLYAGALALVTPSLCYEVFPMVALEAFREGTPIVARRLGPYPQIVAESGAGLLFDDAAGLADAIRTLAADPRLRVCMGEAGRAALADRWSEQRAIADWLRLVGEIAARRGRDATSARVAALRTTVPMTQVRTGEQR